MKVLLCAYACLPNRGSEPGNGWNWARSLADAGCSVTVATAAANRTAIEEAGTSSVRFVYISEKSNLGEVLGGQTNVYLRYLAWHQRAHEHFRGHSSEFDVVHHVTWGSLKGGCPLSGLGPPFFLGPVGGGQIVPFRFLRYMGSKAPFELLRAFTSRVMFSPLARRTAKASRLVLAANEDTASLARRLGAERVECIIDSAVEPAFLSASPPVRESASLRLLWVGRIFAIKALPLALEAVAAARRRCDVTLTIVGDGPAANVGRRTAERLGLKDVVTWLGQRPWTEVAAAYDTHDALLFTSLRDSCPAQILEASARGLPVIALNHQGVPTVLPANAGIRVPVSSPRTTVPALASAIVEASSDRKRLAAMGAAGLEQARTQTWASKAAAMVHEYQRVCR